VTSVPGQPTEGEVDLVENRTILNKINFTGVRTQIAAPQVLRNVLRKQRVQQMCRHRHDHRGDRPPSGTPLDKPFSITFPFS
jgi:hypothetical protein